MNFLRARGFDIVSQYMDKHILLPERETEKSAGYDIAIAEDVVLPAGEVKLVPTGLKAYMKSDEVLMLHIRSSMAVRHSLCLANNTGIIDADYYNNAGNEGHIMLAILNFGKEPVHLKKGTRIAQGIFHVYLLADNDVAGSGTARQGGFGSTGR